MQAKTIIDIYEEVLSGERKKFSRSAWHDEQNAVRILKYVIEEKLHMSDEEIRDFICTKWFRNLKLGGMLCTLFSSSSFDAINTVYPDKFKQWEFSNVPKGFWSVANGILAVRWLVEEKLRLTDDQIKKDTDYELFKNNGLSGMLIVVFNNSPFQAINAAYPDKFNIWEFSKVPANYWNIETGIIAVKWLIEEKLQLNNIQIGDICDRSLFINNELGGMLTIVFNGSPFQAINAAYPNEFKPWEFNRVPMNYWDNADNIFSAIQRVLISTNKQIEQLSKYDLAKHGYSRVCGKFNDIEQIRVLYKQKLLAST